MRREKAATYSSYFTVVPRFRRPGHMTSVIITIPSPLPSLKVLFIIFHRPFVDNYCCYCNCKYYSCYSSCNNTCEDKDKWLSWNTDSQYITLLRLVYHSAKYQPRCLLSPKNSCCSPWRQMMVGNLQASDFFQRLRPKNPEDKRRNNCRNWIS